MSGFLGLGPDLLIRIPALVAALTIHEYAHARVALAMGDPTPKHAGRVTLNPLAHLDPIGMIMLWITSFGWGRPVEVNPANFRGDRERGMMAVAAAGPLSNLGLALVSALILSYAPVMPAAVSGFLAVSIRMNVFLAVFNLIPLPPLDGSKVLFGILPRRIAYEYFARVQAMGPFLLLLLVFSGALWRVLGPLAFGMERLILRIAGF